MERFLDARSANHISTRTIKIELSRDGSLHYSICQHPPFNAASVLLVLIGSERHNLIFMDPDLFPERSFRS